LTDRKNTLMDRYPDGRIPQYTCEEQDERLSSEIEQTKGELRRVEADDEQIENLLEFAKQVLADPAGTLGAWVAGTKATAAKVFYFLPDLATRGRKDWNRGNSFILQRC
jgi:hypothetical protein